MHEICENGDKVAIVSVVRDRVMYEKCLRENPFTAGCELHSIDNLAKNETIPVCYNRFLKSRVAGERTWYVFCHEDFEPKEGVGYLMKGLDEESLWGPIGATTHVRLLLYHQWRVLGQVEESAKDGSLERSVGTPVPRGTPVETFDCQCLIVHSSLVQKHSLVFDENLSFDLYVEEFCMAAAKKGIPSRILPMAARHWSRGSLLPRYAEQEAYLCAKYPDDCFSGASSWILGGKPSFGRRLTVAARRAKQRLCCG